MRTTTEALILWEQRIKERIKSGMSVSQWCRENGINKSKYHYWNQKLTKIENKATEIAFVEVTSMASNIIAPKPTSNKLDDFQVFFKSMQITVPSNFNEDSLAGLMRVLQKL